MWFRPADTALEGGLPAAAYLLTPESGYSGTYLL